MREQECQRNISHHCMGGTALIATEALCFVAVFRSQPCDFVLVWVICIGYNITTFNPAITAGEIWGFNKLF